MAENSKPTRVRVIVEMDVTGYSGAEAEKHATHFAAYALNDSIVRRQFFSGQTVKNVFVVEAKEHRYV